MGAERILCTDGNENGIDEVFDLFPAEGSEIMVLKLSLHPGSFASVDVLRECVLKLRVDWCYHYRCRTYLK